MKRNGNGDKRPDPKPRKNAKLWQAYLWWDELCQLRKRHLLRISSIEAGKSNLDAQYEKNMMKVLQLDAFVDPTRKEHREFSPESAMLKYGAEVGPIWEWLTNIKGLVAGGMAAQLLALIDDVSKFDTVSKLWRFAGYAVMDGKAEMRQKGETSHYNSRLKGLMYNIAIQFIRQQTPVYSNIYYETKERDRRLHPIAVCQECGDACMKGKNGEGQTIWRCPNNAKHHTLYTDAHLDARAHRKVIKIFLQHLWVKWRESEGLPISEPYVEAVLNHTHIF